MDETVSLLSKNKMKWIGKAPCFVADKKRLKSTIDGFRRNFPGEIAYSFKTNPDLQIAGLISSMGCNFLVSSPDELEKLVTIKNIKKNKLIFQSPSLTKGQLFRLLKLGVKRFSIDSLDQLDLILKNVPFEKDDFELFVRINTGFKVKNPDLPYGMDSFLGFPMEDAIPVLMNLNRLRKKANIKIGLHNHLISQNTYPDAWKKNVDIIADFVKKMKDLGIWIDYVNFGGGYPVKYDKKVPSLEHIGKILSAGRKKMSKVFPEMKYIYEPGRKLVAESIVLVGEVVHMKKFKNTDIAILNCSLYNCALDTLIVDLYLPVCVAGKKGNCKKEKKYVLRGSTPDSLDVFGRDVKLPKLQNGDHLVFQVAGAYSFGSEFISLPGAKTILI